ncbi:MAG: hypothetical protein O3C55_04835 [Proteobacteria bacterium]|nr:hypothetical protein [Pseudomonadota bacterium]
MVLWTIINFFLGVFILVMIFMALGFKYNFVEGRWEGSDPTETETEIDPTSLFHAIFDDSSTLRSPNVGRVLTTIFGVYLMICAVAAFWTHGDEFPLFFLWEFIKNIPTVWLKD